MENLFLTLSRWMNIFWDSQTFFFDTDSLFLSPALLVLKTQLTISKCIFIGLSEFPLKLLKNIHILQGNKKFTYIPFWSVCVLMH